MRVRFAWAQYCNFLKSASAFRWKYRKVSQEGRGLCLPITTTHPPMRMETSDEYCNQYAVTPCVSSVSPDCSFLSPVVSPLIFKIETPLPDCLCNTPVLASCSNLSYRVVFFPLVLLYLTLTPVCSSAPSSLPHHTLVIPGVPLGFWTWLLQYTTKQRKLQIYKCVHAHFPTQRQIPRQKACVEKDDNIKRVICMEGGN